MLETFHRGAQAHLGAQFDGSFAQHLVQGAARDTHIGRILRTGQALARDARQLLPFGGIDGHVLEGVGGIKVGFEQAQPVHLAHHIALLNDADAVDGPLGFQLDQIDGDALAAQGDGGTQPANSAAHDQHVVHSIHGMSHVLFLLCAPSCGAAVSCAYAQLPACAGP
ncbi:hypothetical protein D3C80_1008980 [compost metagenome]